MINMLQFILHGGATQRFHTMRTLQSNTVAHHSFGVAWITYLLSQGAPSINLIMSALAHDLAEHKVGDVPSPTKRSVPGLAEHLDRLEASHLASMGMVWDLTENEERILKLADIYDGMLYCISELSLGNQGIRIAFHRFNEYAKSITHTDLEEQMRVDILHLWINENRSYTYAEIANEQQ